MHCVVKHSGFLPPPKALKEQSNCFSSPVLGTQINSSKRDETPTDVYKQPGSAECQPGQQGGGNTTSFPTYFLHHNYQHFRHL